MRKIDDPNIRELYYRIFYYLHGDDNDYINHLTYLKRKIKINTLEKSEKYSSYMNDRERVENQIEEFEKENKFETSTNNYNHMMIDHLKEITEKREKLIKKAILLLERQNKK